MAGCYSDAYCMFEVTPTKVSYICKCKTSLLLPPHLLTLFSTLLLTIHFIIIMINFVDLTAIAWWVVGMRFCIMPWSPCCWISHNHLAIVSPLRPSRVWSGLHSRQPNNKPQGPPSLTMDDSKYVQIGRMELRFWNCNQHIVCYNDVNMVQVTPTTTFMHVKPVNNCHHHYSFQRCSSQVTHQSLLHPAITTATPSQSSSLHLLVYIFATSAMA